MPPRIFRQVSSDRVVQGPTNSQLGVGCKAFLVGVVTAPHDVLRAHEIDHSRVERRQLSGEKAVPLDVFARRQGQLVDRRSAEHPVGAVAGLRLHGGHHGVEHADLARHPIRALLGRHESQRRVPLEHPGQDQVSKCALSPHRHLGDQHRVGRRLIHRHLRTAGARMLHHREVQVRAQRPDRFIAGVKKRSHERVTGRDRRNEHATKAVLLRHPSGFLPAPARRRWERSESTRGVGPGPANRSRSATGCGPAHRPNASQSLHVCGAS